MMNITTLVNKFTGKGAAPDSAAKGSDTPGIATGGEFAELVRMAAKDSASAQGAGLKLVVNNAAPATGIEAALATQGAAAAMLQMTSPEDATSKPILTSGESEATEGDTDDQAVTGDMTGTPAAIALGAFVVAQPSTQAAATGEETAPGASAPSILAMSSGLNSQVSDAKTSPKVMLREAAKAAANEMTTDGVASTAITSATSDDEATASSFASASRAAATTTPKAITDAAPTGQSMRTIFESLPPVIQSDLGTSSVGGVTGPSMGEVLGEQVIDMGVSGQWIDRMAKEIAGLAEGNGHSRFTLNPPHLGRLQIDVWQGEGSTDVRLLTETDEATRRLAEGRPALQADARMAALNLGQITVEKSSASSSSSDSGSRDQGQAGRDLSGNAQQQNDRGAQTQSEKSEWLARAMRNQTSQPGEAVASASAQRAADGHVRFA